MGQVPFDGMQAVASVEQAIERAVQEGAQELCVIGGGEVYRLTMPPGARHGSLVRASPALIAGLEA